MKKNISVQFYPHPFTEFTIVSVNGLQTERQLRFELFNALGKRKYQTTISSGYPFKLTRNGLEKGLYLYSISDAGRMIKSGKILISDRKRRGQMPQNLQKTESGS